MRFFEYSRKNGFSYYALIGAENREKANDFYEEIISSRDDTEPTEITSEEAKAKLLNTCHDAVSKAQAIKDFGIYTNRPRPYMILCDMEFA